MPLVTAASIDRLLDAYDPVEGRSIVAPEPCRPTRQPRAVGPALLPRHDGADRRRGARALLRRHADAVAEVALDDTVLRDFDTAESSRGPARVTAQAGRAIFAQPIRPEPPMPARAAFSALLRSDAGRLHAAARHLRAAGPTPPRSRRAGPAPIRSFNRQNRYLISERDTTDSPFSTSGVSGITTRGLTQRYDYDTALASCLRRRTRPSRGHVVPRRRPSRRHRRDATGPY